MKGFLCFVMFFISANIAGQLEFHYENENLILPDWLTNPNYMAENESEELHISIKEEIIENINAYTIVKISMIEDMNNYGRVTIYLGTFDQNKDIVDIMYLTDHSSTDWNWISEARFEIMPNDVLSYFYVEVSYRPAENEEEQQQTGGMVLSMADTTLECFQIETDGTIHSIEACNEAENNYNSVIDIDEEAEILKIRASFIEINEKINSYTRKNQSPESGINYIYYLKDDRIKKIIVAFPSEQITQEYYFDEEKIIFLYSLNKVSKDENRYYFFNQQLFRWLKGPEKIKVERDTEEFKEKESELSTQFQKIFGKIFELKNQKLK